MILCFDGLTPVVYDCSVYLLLHDCDFDLW